MPLPLLNHGGLPDRRNHNAVANIRVGVAPIPLRIGHIGVAKAAISLARSTLNAIGESRADVIQRVGVGVVRNQCQTGVVRFSDWNLMFMAS
jgi:hypothetical protein